MATPTTRAQWTAPTDAAAPRRADGTGRLITPPPALKRLEQATSSLEPEYAVLSEAAARNAELQAMLRHSQPLLWLDNALVLHREKAQHHTRKTTQRRQGTVGTARAADDDTGEWDELFLESDRRRRHRVQWEVAKRIARVEREISRQPLAQRSWHVREKKRQEEEATRRLEEAAAKEKQRLQQEKDERERRIATQKKKPNRVEPKQVAFAIQEPKEKVVKPQEAKKAVLPSKRDNELDFEWPSKSEKPSTQPLSKTLEPEDDDTQEKENTNHQQLETTEVSPVVPSQGKQDSDPSDERLLEIVRESLEDKINPSSPEAIHTKPSTNFVEEESDANSFAVERNRGDLAASKQPQAAPLVSSLGRQVLSEYRTMSTAATFGAPVKTGSGLNSDVLRRLFSDLDSDRDGHLNRIEMSLALHRLHIDVPATRIVSFFKRIHVIQAESQSPHARRRGRERFRTVEPLKEVINYKQFVAFVTTAFQQQQQQPKATPKVSHFHRDIGKSAGVKDRNECQFALPPLQVPHAQEHSLPTRMSQPATTSHRSNPQPSEEQERRLLVHTEDDDDVANRVLQQIPEVLVALVLAAAEAPPREMQRIVRSSLEQIGAKSQDDTIVEDVARDLVRKYAERMLITRGDASQLTADVEDISGVRRAAAFFDSLPASIPDVGDPVTAVTTTADWWSVLTEEQITALVHEIWSQRHDVEPVVIARAEVDDYDTPEVNQFGSSQAEAPENQGKFQEDEAGPLPDEPNKSKPVIQRVAEKSVQTGSIELITSPLTSPPLPPPPPPPPLSPPLVAVVAQSTAPPTQPANPPVLPFAARTTLASVLLADATSSLQLNKPTGQGPSKVKDVLARLRRQRRHRQAVVSVTTSLASLDSADQTSNHPESSNVSLTISPATKSKPCNRDQHSERMPLNLSDDALPIDHALHSPLPTREIRFRHAHHMPNVEKVSSSLSVASSSDVMSSFNSSLASSTQLFREMSGSDVWRYATHRRQQRLGRRPRQFKSSHDPDDAGADLSEGEIYPRRTPSDLSDGELYGGTRKKVVRAKNALVADVGRTTSDNLPSHTSSLESGEMLPAMIAMQSAYQQRLIGSSLSSLESGEAEDGILGV